MEKMQFINEL